VLIKHHIAFLKVGVVVPAAVLQPLLRMLLLVVVLVHRMLGMLGVLRVLLLVVARGRLRCCYKLVVRVAEAVPLGRYLLGILVQDWVLGIALAPERRLAAALAAAKAHHVAMALGQQTAAARQGRGARVDVGAAKEHRQGE
jgi:hypothetical protein